MPAPPGKKLDHQIGADEAMQRLEEVFGFRPAYQQRVGAFVVLMSSFERFLEIAAWSVFDAKPDLGEIPFTDKKPITEVVKKVLSKADEMPAGLATMVRLMCNTADDLIAYRNAMAHGWLLPAFPGGEPQFVSNAAYHGEKRSRQAQQAHISENLLDMAVDAAMTLCEAANAVHRVKALPKDEGAQRLTRIVSSLRRARSSASELRHLTALMNTEKY